MKYTIEWLEKKTSSQGNAYIKATLLEGETTIDNVAIFGSFPGFADLAPGVAVEGELTEKEYNGAKSYTLNAPKVEGATRGGGTGMLKAKEASIEKAQNRKEKSIEVAQDRSAWMWAKNNATSLVASHRAYANLSAQEIEDTIEELATKINNFEPLTPFNG